MAIGLLSDEKARLAPKVHDAVDPIRRMLNGSTELTESEVVECLDQVTQVISQGDPATGCPTPCYHAAAFVLDTLYKLWQDPIAERCVSRELFVKQYLLAEVAANQAFIRCARNHEEAARIALQRLGDMWHMNEDPTKELALIVARGLANCYQWARNEFIGLGDTVIRTLEARFTITQTASWPLQELLRRLLELWYDLLDKNHDRELFYVREGLCFRCDRLASLMDRLQMETCSKDAIPLLTAVLNKLSRNGIDFDDLKGKPHQRTKLHAANGFLFAWAGRVSGGSSDERLRQLRKAFRPLMTETPRRNDRRVLHDGSVVLSRPGGAQGLTGRIVDVSDTNPGHLKIALPQPMPPDRERAGEIEASIMLPRYSSQVDHDRKFPAQVIRTIARENDLKAGELSLVLRIDGLSDLREWQELVSTLPLKR